MYSDSPAGVRLYIKGLPTTEKPSMLPIPLNLFKISCTCSASWFVPEGSSTTAVTDVVDGPTPSLSVWYNKVTCEGVVNDSILRNCMVKESEKAYIDTHKLQ